MQYGVSIGSRGLTSWTRRPRFLGAISDKILTVERKRSPRVKFLGRLELPRCILEKI
jgi:hypothetical protein